MSYVEDGDIIALDTGTTMLAFAKKLTEKKNLTIVTNDLNIAAYFDSNKEDITVILLGGVLRLRGIFQNMQRHRVEPFLLGLIEQREPLPVRLAAQHGKVHGQQLDRLLSVESIIVL